MTVEVNKITDVIVGEYGVPIIVQVVDDEGVLVDVSSYTGTITVTVSAPHNEVTITFTGSFVTDGSDGKVQFLPTSSSNFSVSGTWTGQIQLAKTNVISRTVPFDIEVEESLS